MNLRRRLCVSVVAASLALALTACSSPNADPSPTPGDSPKSSSTAEATPTPSAIPQDDKLAAEAKAFFATLPDASTWSTSYTAKGASATKNELGVDGLKTWVESKQQEGWTLKFTTDKPATLVGYLSKNNRIVSFLSATNPDTNKPTTAVFFYPDTTVWPGTSTRS
jgi:hypothetical protein